MTGPKPGRVATGPTLTPRLLEVLEYIKGFIGSHGYAPTYRQIGRGLGIPRNPNAILGHVRRLERLGLIEREPGKARTIRIVEPPGVE